MSRRISQSADLASENLVVSNKLSAKIVQTSQNLSIANTNPTDTLSVGNTLFVKNDIKKLIVKGTIKSDNYDVSSVSGD